MNRFIEDRVSQVGEWLKKNVIAPETPNEISIADIEFDWERMSGSFALALDGEGLEERFFMEYEITGRMKYSPPMFHSPLGAPASFAAIRLDEKTDAAVKHALESIFPRVRAYGWHKDIDVIIDAMTPFKARIIDGVEFEKCQSMIEAGDMTSNFSIDSVDAK